MEEHYNHTLLQGAASMKALLNGPVSGSVGWTCPSNIALIKYWGKRAVQLPMNPSLSMTLQVARTITRVRYDYDPDTTIPALIFRFEGRQSPAFADRISKYIRDLYPYLPLLEHTSLQIDSENTFPHSSGIASSASAMGALALCLTQVQEDIAGSLRSGDFYQKASFLARLGSGSACRSLFPNFSLWGYSEGWSGSSDEFALPVTRFHQSFRDARDTILIVESGEKKVSSRAGHALMESNPYATIRFSQAGENLLVLKDALEAGDWERFVALMEEEALSLHAMMLTGRPGYLLMQPGTLSIIHKVREFRKETGSRIGFTLDAGANVHLIYPDEEADTMDAFISSELISHCENGRLIRDRMGRGPEMI